MPIKSRLFAIALALSLSTPAAAATISLPWGSSTYQILGPTTLTDFFLFNAFAALSPAPPVLEPYLVAPGETFDPTKVFGWEYAVDVTPIRDGIVQAGTFIGGGCYSNHIFCIPLLVAATELASVWGTPSASSLYGTAMASRAPRSSSTTASPKA